MSVADALGWIGTVFVVGLNLPQVWRTCVHGRTAGVPASRAWVAIAVSIVWLGYGLYGGGPIQVVLNTATVTLNAALLLRLVPGRDSRHVAGGLALVVGTVAAVVALGSLAGLLALGVLGALVGTGVYVPQLLALRHTDQVDGVSVASVWLQGAGGACWFGYGLLRSEVVVWSPNVFVLLTTAWTLLLLRDRSTDPALLPAQ